MDIKRVLNQTQTAQLILYSSLKTSYIDHLDTKADFNDLKQLKTFSNVYHLDDKIR